MAAFYALKIIKELGLPLQRRVRMIIGTDEESSWKCVDHYFKHEEAPDMGFAPDADFPIICAEKGIANFFLKKQTNSPSIEKKGEEANSKIQLISFDSGQRVNMVPERATATLLIQNEEKVVEMLSEAFESYCTEQQVTGSVHVKGNQLTFTVEGISAHGAEPFKGVNAGLHLISFLSQYTYPREAQSFISLLQSYFVDDPYGEKLGIAIEDEMTGKLTLNVGVLEYRSETDSKIGLNLRYPVTTSYEAMMQRVEEIAKSFGYEVTDMDNLVPHHVDQNHALIKTLQKVYEEQTGEKATLLSTGGGTYARSLKTGVAFGPLFPGKEETAHQKDEYVEIDDLVRATAIYAQAIYELAIAPTTET
ncbi:dipeptidase PepV [Caldalkalibacillus mannanilyticus]|uniref:dipeptidase PepV n=1 Tax=Caldalkalibacillus mannanilyticus TaxID=1418 RepID=UPI000A700504